MGKLVLCVGGFVAWFVGIGVVSCGKLDLDLGVMLDGDHPPPFRT